MAMILASVTNPFVLGLFARSVQDPKRGNWTLGDLESCVVRKPLLAVFKVKKKKKKKNIFKTTGVRTCLHSTDNRHSHCGCLYYQSAGKKLYSR
jgi:hypothetical protein